MSRMGDLAATDVYNAFDVPLEQSTNVGWANRMGEILTARPPDNPAVAYKTPYFDITEGDIGRATEAALGGMTVTPKGIKAFHSSPHDFDKFDLAKIGTGEGAQVYGHGLYFAESPAVSGQGGDYWKQFARRFQGDEHPPELVNAVQILEATNGNRAAALAKIEEALGNVSPTAYPRAHMERVRDLLASDKQVGPRTYEVNINADPAHMLDWDTKIGQQPKAIQDYFRKQIEQFGPEASMEAQYKIARSRAKGGGVELSAGMSEAGIPGIKYLDQGSRVTDASRKVIEETYELLKNTSQGPEWAKKLAEINALPPPSSNYVVFDPGIIDIMKKYGIAGAAPVGMGALAAQDTYRE